MTTTAAAALALAAEGATVTAATTMKVMTPHIPLVADTNSYASVTLGEMRFLAAAARSSEAAEEDQALLAALPTARLGKKNVSFKICGKYGHDTVLRCPLEG